VGGWVRVGHDDITLIVISVCRHAGKTTCDGNDGAEKSILTATEVVRRPWPPLLLPLVVPLLQLVHEAGGTGRAPHPRPPLDVPPHGLTAAGP